MKRIVIIGGGIAGLAAAHRLVEISEPSQRQMTVIEAAGRLGGTIHTDYRDDFIFERGADSFITEKPEALALAKRLGLESRLIQTNKQHRRSFIVRKGRLRPVPEGFQLLAPSRIWPFVTTDIFSLAGKARMAADLFLPRKSTNGAGDESLASFVRRRLGQEALERMAQPMIGGIYTADPETLSLRATVPRFLDLEQKHRSLILGMLRQGRARGTSGARYSLFLSFDRGMQVLVDALIDAIDGVNIRLNSRVVSLKRALKTWTIATNTGEQFEADEVCLAVPAHVAASLLNDIDENLATKLRRIKYASTATLNFAYPRDAVSHPLDGFGFVVPFIEKRSIIACTFSSVKFPGRAPADRVLLRAFAGGALQPEVFALDESEIVARAEADLRELLGITGRPLFAEVSKLERSVPQYEVGHLERITDIEGVVSGIPGLSLAGNSYRGTGIPDCIRSGETVVDQILF